MANASVDVTGIANFSKSIRRAVSGDLQRTMVKNIQDSAPKLLADIRVSASTRIQKKAVGSVTIAKSSAGIDLSGGRGADLAATLFDGAEYGGRKSKRVTYSTRSPAGTAYIVRRRTTMQFLVHLGRRGYMYWPAVREWLPKLSKDQEALLEKALR